MRVGFSTLMVGILLAGVGTAAAAREHNGYQQIVQGDYVTAERMLVSERRMFPDQPELTLNLAAVYLHTGRISEARALYADVLSRPNEQLDMPANRAAWSHDVAATALRGLDSVKLSSR